MYKSIQNQRSQQNKIYFLQEQILSSKKSDIWAIWVSSTKDHLEIFFTTHHLPPKRPPIFDPWDFPVDVLWSSESKPSYFPLWSFFVILGPSTSIHDHLNWVVRTDAHISNSNVLIIFQTKIGWTKMWGRPVKRS